MSEHESAHGATGSLSLGGSDPSGPYVLQTLVLANNTVVPGNFLAQSGLTDAGAMAYDPARGTVFVEYAEPGMPTVAVISDATNSVEATIPIGGTTGGTVEGLAVDSGKGELFVSGLANRVAVVNETTDSVVADVSIAEPSGIAYDPQSGEVFVTNYPVNMVSVINDSNNTVVATISAGGGNGTGMAFDSAMGEIFVAGSHGSVSVISGATRSLVTRIPVGQEPWAIAYDRAKGELFVANSGSANVSVISDTTDRVVATVAVGVAPEALTYDPSMGEVFVEDSGSNQVSVINDTSDTVSFVLGVGSGPDGAAYDSARGEIFVANSGSGNVSVISGSTGEVLATIEEPYGPIGMTYDTDTAQMFVSDYFGSRVEVVSGATGMVVASIPVGTFPRGVAYDPPLGEVFVANWGSSSVSVISDATDTVVASVALPPASYPIDVAYDSGTGQIFVTNEYGNATGVISATTLSLVSTIPVGVYPVGLAYDVAQGELFVANSGSDNVSVISDSTDSVVATIGVGDVPYGVAYDSGTAEVFVANSASQNVSVISDETDTVVASVAAAWVPLWPAYDPATGEVFVSDSQSANVSVILDATDSVVASVPVGASPNGISFDPGNGRLFVADMAQGTLSIVANGFANRVTFVQNGLPTGILWSTTLNGTQLGSHGASIGFLEGNGSYDFSVGAVRSGIYFYNPSPATGTCSVQGTNVTVAVSFTPTVDYNVTLSESGLPTGETWYLNLSGGTSLSSTVSWLTAWLPNGTYTYSIGSQNRSWDAPGGSFTVDGASLDLSVTFTLQEYRVTISEVGLPTALLAKYGWTAALGGTVLHGSTPEINFTEPSGTYGLFTVGPKGYSSGNQVAGIVVSGVYVLQISFVPGKTVALTFHQKGLAPGQSWCVEIASDETLSGSGYHYSYPLCTTRASETYTDLSPDGVYPFVVLSPRVGQNITQQIGRSTSYGVSGVVPQGKGATLTFAYRYPLELTESGLPAGMSWSVTVKGVTEHSITSTITFYEPNGTYRYKVGSEAGYVTSGAPGTAKVNGGSASVAVTFKLRSGHLPVPHMVGPIVLQPRASQGPVTGNQVTGRLRT